MIETAKIFPYTIFGEKNKKVFICLPGYADEAELFNDFAKHLAKRYKVVLPEFPMIHTEKKVESLKTLTEYLETFCQHLKLTRFTLLGFSLGGMVATNYAFHHLEKIEKLYLLSSLPQLIISRKKLALYRLVKPILTNGLFCKIYLRFNVNDAIRKIYGSENMKPNREKMMRDHPISIFGTFFNIGDGQLRGQFNSLSIPKTIILFEDDKILKLEKYRKFIKTLKCQFVIFKKGGHANSKNYWKKVKSVF